jgi:LacI family transcriptional regulator
MSQRRVTISDVAELAGVSYQTVSRVINNSPNVSVTTRQRVEKIINETGYRPSHIARSLVTTRTATIGLVVPDISNPFFSAVARGADQVASENGYSILLCNTGEDAARETDVLSLLHERYVDGVIVCGARQDDAQLQKSLSQFDATVLVNRRLAGAMTPAVLVDDALGGAMITQHLLQLGHRAIGFVAGPAASYSSQQRLKGYQAALSAASIEPQPRWVRHCLPTSTAGEEAAQWLLTSCPELSALFCYNDLVALGALRACATAGHQVPADVAITGFDDIMLAGVVSPALTTCHVPRAELGSRAVAMLLDCIEDKVDTCDEIVIKPELVIRASTAVSEPAEYR